MEPAQISHLNDYRRPNGQFGSAPARESDLTDLQRPSRGGPVQPGGPSPYGQRIRIAALVNEPEYDHQRFTKFEVSDVAGLDSTDEVTTALIRAGASPRHAREVSPQIVRARMIAGAYEEGEGQAMDDAEERDWAAGEHGPYEPVVGISAMDASQWYGDGDGVDYRQWAVANCDYWQERADDLIADALGHRNGPTDPQF